MDIYGNLDFWGIAVGILSFFLAFLYSYYLLQKFDLNRRAILNMVLVSAIGHFIGAIALYYYAYKIGADSVFYFQNATMDLKNFGFGYWFAFVVLGYLKFYLLGESFLGSFLMSGAIGLIGSVYYLLTFKILLDKISDKYAYYRIDQAQLLYPALLLLCWPSYFFWSAAIIKDNFAFISIAMILFVIARGKLSLSSFIMLGIAFFLGFMVRPYLFVIFAISSGIYILLGSKLNFFLKFSILVILALMALLLMPVLTQYGMIVHFSGGSLGDVGKYAVRQQQYGNIGSSIPVPTHNPYLTFFFIPYLVLADLFLPLGIGANNFIGMISSVENAYFLFWAYIFLKQKEIWRKLKQKIPTIKFFMIYSLFGMSCLSIMNSNLGLAMREKMMYVPALLICIFLTYAYSRILSIKSQQALRGKEQPA